MPLPAPLLLVVAVVATAPPLAGGPARCCAAADGLLARPCCHQGGLSPALLAHAAGVPPPQQRRHCCRVRTPLLPARRQRGPRAAQGRLLTPRAAQLDQLLVVGACSLASIIKVAQEDFLGLVPQLAAPALGFAIPEHAPAAVQQVGAAAAARIAACSQRPAARLLRPPAPHLYWRLSFSRSASDSSAAGACSSSADRMLRRSAPASCSALAKRSHS